MPQPQPAPVATPPRLPRHSNVSPNQPSAAPRRLEPEFNSEVQPTYPTRTLHSAVSRAPHRLPDGRWELGSEYQSAMVKSANTLVVTKLGLKADYSGLKAWSSAVEDWVFNHTNVYPENLGPAAIRSVARMTMEPELYTALDTDGALGNRHDGSLDTHWESLMEHLRDILGCSAINLKLGLATLR